MTTPLIQSILRWLCNEPTKTEIPERREILPKAKDPYFLHPTQGAYAGPDRRGMTECETEGCLHKYHSRSYCPLCGYPPEENPDD